MTVKPLTERREFVAPDGRKFWIQTEWIDHKARRVGSMDMTDFRQLTKREIGGDLTPRECDQLAAYLGWLPSRRRHRLPAFMRKKS